MKKRDYLKIIAERAQTANYTAIRRGRFLKRRRALLRSETRWFSG
ncbi:Hypothetical protein ABZS17G119_00805 [Kosakonia cowanii]